MKILTDNDPMPYGKYQGQKMANVPSQYLIWLLKENKCYGPVKKYIQDNLEVLKKEV